MKQITQLQVHGGGGSNPIFAQDTPKFGFGDGQKWEKIIWKEREKTFVLTHCWYIVIIFFCILNKIYRVTFCMTY